MSRAWFKMYTADYLADTTHLTMLEQGAYAKLMFSYYNQGKPISKRLANRLANANSTEECDAVQLVLEQYFIADVEDGVEVYRHKRIDEELSKLESQYERKVSNAKNSAAKRITERIAKHDAKRITKHNAERIAKRVQPEPEPESDIIKEKEIKKENPHDPPRGNSSSDLKYSKSFQEFWECYPSKVGKSKAYKVWKARKLERLLLEITDGIERLKKTKKWQAGFVFNPDTFLRNEHWNDEPCEVIQFAGTDAAAAGTKTMDWGQ